MAGCPAQSFSNIGPDTLAILKAKGAAAGLPITGDTGQATTMRVTLRWQYDQASETLLVECTDAPFFVPCSTITGRVQELIDDCRPRTV